MDIADLRKQYDELERFWQTNPEAQQSKAFENLLAAIRELLEEPNPDLEELAKAVTRAQEWRDKIKF